MRIYGKVRPSHFNDLGMIDFLVDYGFKIVQMEMGKNTIKYLKEENYNIPAVFHGTRRNKEIAEGLGCKAC